MTVIQNKLTTTALTAVVLFPIISMAILLYICAMTAWTINIHKLWVWLLQSYDFVLVVFFSITSDTPPIFLTFLCYISITAITLLLWAPFH